MSALFLDLGKSAGWAVERRDGREEHGTWKLPSKPAQRFFEWRRKLTDIKARLQLDGDPLVQACFEEVDFMPPKNGIYAAHCYGAAWGLLLVWCMHHGIPCRGVPVGRIKTCLTGRASAAKPLVTEAIRKRGYSFDSTDEADAIALMITVGDRYKPVHTEAA